MKRLVLVTAAAVVVAVVGLLSFGTASASHVNDVTIDSITRNADGSVTVTGTMTCTIGSLNSADVQVSVEQGTNDGSVNTGTFSPCGGGTTFDWSVDITGDEGKFKAGKNIHIEAQVSCCIAPGGNDFAEADVKLTGAGGGSQADLANTCANAGAGNGVEAIVDGECVTQTDPVDGGEQNPRDIDPGNSGENNSVPATAP